MRMKGLWPVLGLGVLVAGCITQPSLQPLFTEDDCVAVPEIGGTWLTQGDDDPTTLTLRPKAGGEFEMTLAEKGETQRGAFAVRLGRIGGELYWDLTARPLDRDEGLWGEHRLAVHSFARVRVDGDQLELAFFDPRWVKHAVEAGRLDASHAQVDGDVLLTAPTPELQRLIAEHAWEEDFFVEPAVFRRQAVP